MKSAEESNIKFRRSIYVVKNIKEGETLTKDNVRRIRPGYGLKPKEYEKLIGSIANKDLNKGTPLKKDDFIKNS
jgi:N-acetylneuraminate synthase